MKRNMIMIVLDSITYTTINEDKTRKSPTPFLQSLINKSVRVENMYSQAPYTEAALVSLQCGTNTLDDFGHMRRNKYKNTIFDIYKNNGYEVLTDAFQPAIYPSGQMPEFEKRYYNFPFLFSQVWNYRLKYFREIYLKDKLDKNEIKLLIDIMDDNFEAATKFFDDLTNQTEEIKYIYNSINLEGLEESKKTLKEQYSNYKNNKEEYIFDLLTKGQEHDLIRIKEFLLKNKIKDREFVIKQSKKRKKIINKIFWKNFRCNLINNHLSIKKIINYIKDKDYKTLKKYCINYLNALIDKDLHLRIDKNYDGLKYIPSLNAMLEHSIEMIENRDATKPFFSYIHADDTHFEETFFSYDTTDEKLLDEEFKQIEEGLKNIKNSYKGSIACDLSLRYADNCVKKYFKILEEKGILEDTDVIITSDHGFSYYYKPIRESFVTTYYKENYHIPFIIVSPTIKNKKAGNKFFMSKDIVPTMLSISGIKIPKSVNGVDIFNSDGRDYAMIEFMGGGCPHYYRRPFKLGVQTKKYRIVLEIHLNQKFEEYKIISCYDLVKDPLELNDIKNIVDKEKIENELELIATRFYELQKAIRKEGYYKYKKNKN